MIKMKKDTALRYCLAAGRFGSVLIYWDEHDFPLVKGLLLPSRAQERMICETPAASAPPLAEKITAYLNGEKTRFTEQDLDWRAFSPFRLAVSRAAMKIPYGRTWSYGRLAQEAGSPRAARAVGGVMAANPFPIVVPCHRVIRSDGGLGGFTGGLELKKRLLKMEGADFQAAGVEDSF